MSLKNMCVYRHAQVRMYLFLLYCVLASQVSIAQCTGNAGDNIFLQGDFGSGTSNIILSDPGLAPGYRYVLTVPPDDGEYVITNDISVWPYLWPTWLAIGDNSDDPNGYMMVVNASFSAGIFFEEKVTDLCELTTYNFSADIINLILKPTLNHLLPNVSFFIDGMEVFNTGDIQQDEIWHTYEFSFETKSNQTELDLSLRNNGPGGFGNDVGLDNITFKSCGPQIFIESITNGPLCERANAFKILPTISQGPNKGMYQWQESFDEGQSWNNISGGLHRDSLTFNNLPSSVYYYRLIYATSSAGLTNDKCLIPSNVVVVVVPPLNYFEMDTICEGLTYLFDNQELNTSGNYQAKLISSLNCDSIVNLELTVVADPHITAELASMDPDCAGATNGIIDIQAINNAFNPFELTLNDKPYALPEFPINVGAGIYNLEVVDRFGCGYKEIISVIDPMPFVVRNVHDTIINLGDSVHIHPTSNYMPLTSSWLQDDIIICQLCLEIILKPYSTQRYIGLFANENNCTMEIPFTIRVVQDRPIFIPDAFTPGDGDPPLNDMFLIFSPRHLITQVVSLRVFNRWGVLLFERSNFLPDVESLGWDGKVKDQLVAPGVYIYTYVVRYIDDVMIPGSGSVTVLR